MPWAGNLASVSPVGAASSDIVTYVLGYGPLGVVLVILGILIWRGWDIRSPARRDKDRAEDRADLERENARLMAERDKIQDQLTELQGYIRDQFGPLIANFTTATQALLPVLQQRVTEREGRRAPGRRAGA